MFRYNASPALFWCSHKMAYANFKGDIPKRNRLYVKVWDPAGTSETRWFWKKFIVFKNFILVLVQIDRTVVMVKVILIQLNMMLQLEFGMVDGILSPIQSYQHGYKTMIIWSIGIVLQFLHLATAFLQYSGSGKTRDPWTRPDNLVQGPTDSNLILRWHTETGNIWTHLIGGLIFIGLTLYYLLLPNMRFTGKLFHTWIFYGYTRARLQYHFDLWKLLTSHTAPQSWPL